MNGVITRLYEGAREDLRSLFELAEDSPSQLDAYMGLGRILVALSGDEIVGHLQVTQTGHAAEFEIKNMAVRESHQGRGTGRALVESVIKLLAAESAENLVVATATADIGNLRFYQRQGFRMRSIERDAFTAASGYQPDVVVDGIPLRDRVWLDRPLPTRPRTHRRVVMLPP